MSDSFGANTAESKSHGMIEIMILDFTLQKWRALKRLGIPSMYPRTLYVSNAQMKQKKRRVA